MVINSRAQVVKYRSQTQAGRSVEFDVNPDYRVEEIIGEGAYGIVASAVHTPTGTRVAIKKIHPFDRPMFCMRTLREIRLLRHFNSENIISILDIQRPNTLDGFKDVYLIQELMDSDLSRVIRSQSLTDDHCQYFTYQTLRALKVLHSAEVLHRDLKPQNLLVNANCDLKICDFGLARLATSQPGHDSNVGFMTEYVATRWYRAPEIMLTFQHYTKAIDIWSVGCILAEMLGRRPLFPGKDYCDQLDLILSTLGTPSPEDYFCIKGRRARQYIQNLPHHPPQRFEELYPKANPQAIDLLKRMLTFNPANRISVEDALAHPYLAHYHDPRDEPCAPPVPQSFFDFEKGGEVPIADMKKLVFEEITQDSPNWLSAASSPYRQDAVMSSGVPPATSGQPVAI